jgi:hypothetical protein
MFGALKSLHFLMVFVNFVLLLPLGPVGSLGSYALLSLTAPLPKSSGKILAEGFFLVNLSGVEK